MNTDRLFIVTLAIALAPLLLCAQDEENLYIPPELIVRDHHADDGVLRFRFYDESEEVTLPLLPIIFFDHPGDWTIPARYRFTANPDRYIDTLDHWPQITAGTKYYELLDIVGYRMDRFSAATITLRPGYSAEPGEAPDIATTRAEVVRDYLRERWKIESNRIAIASPERLSERDDILPRHEEARRVMIETANWELIRPVRYAARERSTLPLYLNLLIRPNLPSDHVAAIDIVVMAGDTVIGRDGVSGDRETMRYELNGVWNCTECDPRTLDRTLTATAIITTHDGREFRSNGVTIEARGHRPESAIADWEDTLIPFFGFRDSTLTDYQKRIVRELIDSIATAGRAIVQTSGAVEFSEDALGDPVEKESLFRQRASARSERPTPLRSPPSAAALQLVRPPWESEEDVLFDNEAGGTVSITWDGPVRNLLFDEEIPSFYRLPVARTSSVLSYIRDSLTTIIVNESRTYGDFVPQLVSAYPREGGILHSLPEERWYARCVRLVVKGEESIRSYEGEWEEWEEESEEIPEIDE